MRTLFVSSEAHPLIKTGGLGDVSGALPAALQALGEDVRLLLPAYRPLRQQLEHRVAARFTIEGYGEEIALLEARMPESGVPLYLVDAPALFDRDHGPYGDDSGDWADNAERFAAFCRAAVAIAMGRAGINWRPELVHCNDWPSGLVPALLSREKSPPPSLFTIHNLAYQGRFPGESFTRLGLPSPLWTLHGLEFHGMLSFIKGGVAFADAVSTVSPNYASEIQRPEHGHGLDGLLRHRAAELHGILNGIDTEEWDPRRDPLIRHHYHAERMGGKGKNKAALQHDLGLEPTAKTPLLGLVSRLVEQKGIDLLVPVLEPLLATGRVQLALLGSGERPLETTLEALARRHPGSAAVMIGYDEGLAHRIEAGADIFLMPSRFEPCGLNQLYSLRYGTVPVAHRVGGLADTVRDFTDTALVSGEATGFLFEHADPEGLNWALQRALALYQRPRKWRQLQKNGMALDFSWARSAARYRALYQTLKAQGHG